MERTPRRDRGQVRLNARDLALLEWIGEQYAVRLDTLQGLLGQRAQNETKEADRVQESAARRVIARWYQAGLVEQHKILVGEPAWIYLTRQGLRQVGLDYRVWRPSVAMLNHVHWVNQVRLVTELKYRELRAWRSERRLRQLYYGRQYFHVPDGEIITTQRETIAVEVELTLKSRKRARQIVETLAYHYDLVWYFVTAETYGLVKEATAEWSGMFRLYRLENVVG